MCVTNPFAQLQQQQSPLHTLINTHHHPDGAGDSAHLALANANSHYFEVPVPIDDFLIQGVDHFQLGSNGHVSAPKKAGLGLDIDWSIIEATASACVEF